MNGRRGLRKTGREIDEEVSWETGIFLLGQLVLPLHAADIDEKANNREHSLIHWELNGFDCCEEKDWHFAVYSKPTKYFKKDSGTLWHLGKHRHKLLLYRNCKTLCQLWDASQNKSCSNSLSHTLSLVFLTLHTRWTLFCRGKKTKHKRIVYIILMHAQNYADARNRMWYSFGICIQNVDPDAQTHKKRPQ